MKIALFDISHWHFPLYHAALRDPGIDVVGLSDPSETVRAEGAAVWGCPAYATSTQLIEAGDFDFAFIFGRHVDMPQTAARLIDRGIPFSIEKPGGTCAGDVAALRKAAAAKNLFVSVAFVERLGPLYRELTRLQAEEDATYFSSSWRFFAGPPARYPAMGCAWMLDPALSGGGCLINLAGHFIDAAVQLHGPPVERVAALTNNGLFGEAVEDYAQLSMRLGAGKVAQIETGYCFPSGPVQREFSFTIVGDRHYLQSHAKGFQVFNRDSGEAELVSCIINADLLFAEYASHVLAAVREGGAPVATLADLETVMQVIDQAYAQNRAMPHRP